MHASPQDRTTVISWVGLHNVALTHKPCVILDIKNINLLISLILYCCLYWIFLIFKNFKLFLSALIGYFNFFMVNYIFFSTFFVGPPTNFLYNITAEIRVDRWTLIIFVRLSPRPTITLLVYLAICLWLFYIIDFY